MAWPLRSPDLTPVDFLLQGHTEPLICTSPVDSEEALIARIGEAAANIKQQTGIFKCTRQTLQRCCRPCIEVGGRTLNICSKLVLITFLQTTSMALLDVEP